VQTEVTLIVKLDFNVKCGIFKYIKTISARQGVVGMEAVEKAALIERITQSLVKNSHMEPTIAHETARRWVTMS
jgi:hypothetical protein